MRLVFYNIFNCHGPLIDKSLIYLAQQKYDLFIFAESLPIDLSFFPNKSTINTYNGKSLSSIYDVLTCIFDAKLCEIDLINSSEFEYNGLVDKRCCINIEASFKIAAVHLPGGRYVDQLIFNGEQGIFEKLMEHRRKILNLDSDIIIGDFNVITKQDPNFDEQYKNILPYIGKFEKRFNDWIDDLDNLLLSSGFIYIVPEYTAEHHYSNIRGKTTVESVWVRAELVTKYKITSRILNNDSKFKIGFEVGSKFASDHYPIELIIE